MSVWHCHDQAVYLLPVGLEIFCELHRESSTELHSMIQNSHFHHASENGLTVLFSESQNTVSRTFLADGLTLNFLAALKDDLIRVGSDADMIRPQ
jgi:hypothetical protein